MYWLKQNVAEREEKQLSRQSICNICSVCNRNARNDCTVSNVSSYVSVTVKKSNYTAKTIKRKNKKKEENDSSGNCSFNQEDQNIWKIGFLFWTTTQELRKRYIDEKLEKILRLSNLRMNFIEFVNARKQHGLLRSFVNVF